MAPYAPAIALALAFGIGGRAGDSFCYAPNLANSAACSRRRPRAATVVAKTRSIGSAAQGGAGSGDRGERSGGSRCEGVLGLAAADTEGTALFGQYSNTFERPTC